MTKKKPPSGGAGPPSEPPQDPPPAKPRKPRKRKKAGKDNLITVDASLMPGPPAAPQSQQGGIAGRKPPATMTAQPPAAGLPAVITAPPPGKPLPPKQERFVRELLANNFNATLATIKAGYSEKGARSMGSQLLTNLNVQRRIAILMQESTERVARPPNAQEMELCADNTMRHLRNLAYSNILDYFQIDEKGQPTLDLAKVTRDQGSAIQKVKIKQLEPLLSIVDGGVIVPREVTQIEFALWDKPKALEILMKNQGLLADAVPVVNIQFIDNLLVNVRNQIIAKGQDPDVVLKQIEQEVRGNSTTPGTAG